MWLDWFHSGKWRVVSLLTDDKEKKVYERLSRQAGKLRVAARSFKEKFETKEKELVEKASAISKLEEELKKLKENPVQTGSSGADVTETGSVASTGEDKLAEAELLVSPQAGNP